MFVLRVNKDVMKLKHVVLTQKSISHIFILSPIHYFGFIYSVYNEAWSVNHSPSLEPVLSPSLHGNYNFKHIIHMIGMGCDRLASENGCSTDFSNEHIDSH